MNRGNLAGRQTIWVRATMRKAPELFLLEVENIQPTVLSAHPKQAGPITVDRHNAVVAKAMRVGSIVLKKACESFGAPVKVRQAQARCHPEPILSIIKKSVALQSRSAPAEWVFGEPPCPALILHQADNRGIRQHPDIAGLVFVQIVRG